MKQLFAILSFAFILASQMSWAQNTNQSIKEDYQTFLQQGCDTTLIKTPIEARILRNVPFAILGYKFNSEDLSFVFSHDGTWYKSTTETLPKLSSENSRCVSRIQARETQFKNSFNIDPQIMSALTKSHKVYFWLRTIFSKSPGRWTSPRSPQKSNREWRLFIKDQDNCGGDGGEESKLDCSGAFIECELPEGETDFSKLKCTMGFAG